MDKRAQIFPVYIFILTLTLSAFSIYLSYKQTDIINQKILSPVGLLEFNDEMFLMNGYEKEVLSGCIKTSSDILIIKENCLNSLTSGNSFVDFLFRNFYDYSNGVYIGDVPAGNRKDMLAKLYSFQLSGDSVRIVRAPVYKKIDFENKDGVPLTIIFKYENAYNLKKV